jgi:hypothetical protein
MSERDDASIPTIIRAIGSIANYAVDIAGIAGILLLARYGLVSGDVAVIMAGMMASIAMGKRYFEMQT